MFQNLRRVQVAASDFPRSRRFYGETLGLPEAGGFENDWVEFGLGPIILKLVPLRPGEVPSRNQVAAILATDRIDETLTALKERGVTVTRGPIDEFTGRSAEILDPDGYRIIVFQASDLHPDDEWVPMSNVDEVVKQKLLARRQKEKAREAATTKKAAAPKKPPAKKAEARKPEAGKSAKKPPAKKAEKKAAPPKKAEKKVEKKAEKKVEKKADKKPAKKAEKKPAKVEARASAKAAAPKAGGAGKKPAKRSGSGDATSAARKRPPASPKGKKH